MIDICRAFAQKITQKPPRVTFPEHITRIPGLLLLSIQCDRDTACF
jgi:hypothetical protein